MNVPPVRMAMSSRIALRRSPNDGALTASALMLPRSLLTTRVASASPSTSSAMMTMFFVTWSTRSSTGSRSCTDEIFLSVIRMYGSSSTASMRSAFVTKYGEDVAAVELHALDELGLGADALGLFDGDDAVLADLLHDVGDDVADLLVVAGDRRHLGDLLLAGDRRRDLADLRLDAVDGHLQAVLEGHRVGAGGDHAHALADDRLGEHGGGRRAVAGDVVGLGSDLAGQLRAEVHERVLELDLLGDGDAVVDDARRPELPLEDHVAAAWPERHAHGIGQGVDAGLQAAPRLFVKQ